MRAKRKGFSTWLAPEAKIWHKVNSSFVGGKPHSHYFWWRSRLLWIERNCLPEERKRLYRSIIFPEIMRTLKHGLLKSIQLILCPTAHRKEKARLYLAGSLGILHYAFRRFGNCPSFLYKRELQKTRSAPASVKLKSLPLDASNQRENRHDKLNIALPEAQQK